MAIGEVLLLSRDEIFRALDPKTALDICDRTFKWINEGKIDQLHTSRIRISEGGIMRPYPAYSGLLRAAGVKWLSGSQSNLRKDLPKSMAVNILNDGETGAPIAVMEGMSVTAMRTGGHAAVGAKYLAKKNSEIVSILGCGFEGRSHLRLMNELFRIKEVRACDIIKLNRDRFISEMQEMLGLDIKPVETIEEAVRGADVVCEVTTSVTPTIIADWVEPGCYIAATNVHGIDPKLSKKADKWVVGNWERDLLWIEGPEALTKVLEREDIFASLDEIAAGKKPGRETNEEITLMTHHGMSALDLTAMYVAYEKAKEKGLGTYIKMF